MTAHWGVEDPAAFVGSEEKTYAFFKRVYGYLDNRIKIFGSLAPAGLARPPVVAAAGLGRNRWDLARGWRRLRALMTEVTIAMIPRAARPATSWA